MLVSEIKLKNFRNYQKAEVETNSNLVLILGKNAAGKTNFLESIYFLSRLKSFRAPDDMLVKKGEDHFSIRGKAGEDKLEAIVQVQPGLKRGFKINGQKTKRSLWQPFASVLFAPADLNLFTLGPAYRRRLLDEILSQNSQEYSVAMASLDHVLKQKSALLALLNQGLGERSELEFWNEQLAEFGSLIETHRADLIEFFNQKINAANRSLTDFDSKLVLQFKSQAKDKAEFLMKLREFQESEVRSGMNLVGPQRDDFIIEKDGVENIYNSSRGELRAQVLALKLLQAEYLSDGEDRPVILLDDVFSELDEIRRSRLIESLSGYQIFITSTEEHHLPKLNKDALILEVKDNKIK